MQSVSLISIILHLGVLLGSGKDILQGVQDLISHHAALGDDLKKILADVVSVLQSGLISIPGISAEQFASVVAEVEKVIGVA